MRFRSAIRRVSMPFHLCLLMVGLWGCSLIDPSQDVPSYVVVPQMEFMPGEDQGTASTNITDLWVYSATDVVGVFPLPAVVPLLPADVLDGPVTLLAGIRENGIGNSRAPYPFYTTVSHFVSADQGKRDTLYPEISLVEDVRLIRVEDFENSNVFGNIGGGEGLVRTDDAEMQFEGEYGGRMVVTADHPIQRARTVEQEYDLATGVPVFLELDYRCNQTFAVGLYGYRNGFETKHLALVINPTEALGEPVRWNKIYVDLGPSIGAQGIADHFEVYVECILEAGRDTGSLGLDNMRILTY